MSEVVSMHTMFGKKKVFYWHSLQEKPQFKFHNINLCACAFYTSFLYVCVQMCPEFKHMVYSVKEFKIFYRDIELC